MNTIRFAKNVLTKEVRDMTKEVRDMTTGEQIVDAIVGGTMLLVLIYLGIGLMSLAMVANGEHVQYMPFWHAPWKWLIESFATK